MIAKNLYKYANETFAKHIATVTELSKIGTTNKSLVESEKEYYNFDAISQAFYPSNKYPTSADGLCVTKTSVQLIEFKSGFKKKLTKENRDKKKSICEHIGIPCEKYWNIFDKNQENETKGLIDSIRFKAIESYVTIEKKILPLCDSLTSEQKKMRITLMIVIDEDGIDNMEDTLAELSGKTKGSDNCFARIKASLNRMHRQKDSQGEDYFYDEISVFSVHDFHARLKN